MHERTEAQGAATKKKLEKFEISKKFEFIKNMKY